MGARSDGTPVLDVLLAVATVAVVAALLVTGPADWVAVALGLPLVLVVPGYLLSVVVFPRRLVDDSVGRDDAPRLGPRVDDDAPFELVVRALLSVASSLVVLFLASMAVVVLSLPFTRPVLLGVVSATVAGLGLLALVRRWQVPAGEHFQPRLSASFGDAVGGTSLSVGPVLLVVCVLVAGAGVGLAFEFDGGEGYTAFYLLGEDDSATEYPQNFTVDEPRSVAVGIENHEQRQQEYTVVVLLQRVPENGSMVTAERRLDRFQVTLEPGETWEERRPVRPTLTGEDLRLTYLLYAGDVPADPSRSNADHSLHLWVTVREA
jgi:uncharacterized membrane protein